MVAMKKILYIIFIASCILSCSLEKESAPAAAPEALRFTAAYTSRTAFSQDLSAISWENGDRVGIYATKGADAIGINYPYSITGIDGATGELSAVSSSCQYGSVESAGATFCAYYPFAGTAGEGNRFVVPVQLPASQEQAAAGDVSHLSDYMILMAGPVSLTGGSAAVNLPFRNMLAVAAIDIKASAANSRNISSVVLKASAPLAFARGNMLLDPGDAAPFTINDASDSVVLNLETPFRLSTEGSRVYFTLTPGSHAAGSIKLKLLTDNGYAAEVAIPEGVNFESNGVYSKTLSVDPASFKKVQEGGEVYIWKPVTAASSVKAGECILAYHYDYGGTVKDFVLPGTAADKNPLPVVLTSLGWSFDDNDNITSEPDELYVWKLTAVDGGWNITHGDNILCGCDQAQGLAISTDGSGAYSSTKTYSSVWSFTDKENFGMQLGLPGTITTRRAMPYYDSASMTQFEWRLAKSDTGGYVLYYKTLVDE